MSDDRKEVSVNRKAWQDLYTPANIVTITRILLVPAFIILMLTPWASWIPEPTIASIVKPWGAALVFILLAATDGLDGYLARSRGEITTFGMLLDPLADKILVSAALLVLIELGLLPAWIALVILGREFLVTGLRMVAAAEGKVIAASNLGKVKTVFQIIAVVTFIVKGSLETIWNILLGPRMIFVVNWFAWIVMGLTLVITIVSLVDYFINSAEVLGFERTGIKSGTTDDPSTSSVTSAPAPHPSSTASLPSTSASHPTTATGENVDKTSADAPEGETRFYPDERYTRGGGVSSFDLAEEVLSLARAKGLRLGTAESCTGGLIAAALTDVAGSSDVFSGAIVSYSNNIKRGLLFVGDEVLATDGAVSEACVLQMVAGALDALGADVVVAVSGIAGPGGGSESKPVGTVWLACSDGALTLSRCELFAGDRAAVRAQTVLAALSMLLEILD
ncbi:MAG: CDP-diacylglycerol--glycerol-3-phosphate 3-phosphatidyltransferase [Coriobacteriia bacterium]|nr:CDP-diacylglycerol--glycerol-3-phosphate 3-phosphatidyltransferase [Coriobacteriia bacterium]